MGTNNLSNEVIIHKTKIVTDKLQRKRIVEYLQFRRLLEYEDRLSHAFSIGLDVNFRTAKANKQKLPKSEYDNAIDSYELLANSIGWDINKIVKTNQEHTDNIAIVEKKINLGKPDFNLNEYTNTDGLITKKDNIMLTTTSADCNILLFFDPVKNVISNVHSGWKGTAKKVAQKTAIKMIKEFDCNPKDIICCICPSIRKCHFEVEQAVKEIFENMCYGDKEKIIKETVPNKKWHIDTVAVNINMLKEIGLISENIIDCGICNVCNKEFFHSYRMEKTGYGLNTALIGLNVFK